jgi:hypothetical protein
MRIARLIEQIGTTDITDYTMVGSTSDGDIEVASSIPFVTYEGISVNYHEFNTVRVALPAALIATVTTDATADRVVDEVVRRTNLALGQVCLAIAAGVLRGYINPDSASAVAAYAAWTAAVEEMKDEVGRVAECGCTRVFDVSYTLSPEFTLRWDGCRHPSDGRRRFVHGAARAW